MPLLERATSPLSPSCSPRWPPRGTHRTTLRIWGSWRHTRVLAPQLRQWPCCGRCRLMAVRRRLPHTVFCSISTGDRAGLMVCASSSAR
uniref:Uncharacterized protein n=1 Tax=Arundo donax TaxID=35708 RepID=A0A0A9DPT1_ARUDO